MKTLLCVMTSMLLLGGVAQASQDLYWIGPDNGAWMDQNNWDEAEAEWYVPGWVEDNPGNIYDDDANNWNKGWARIDSGIAAITAASKPDGRVERIILNGGDLNISADVYSWRFYAGWGAEDVSSTVTQTAGENSIGASGTGFQLGHTDGTTATYNLQGGTFVVRGGLMGNGAETSTGILNISGGTLDMLQNANFLEIGQNGAGIVNQTGGVALLDRPRLGRTESASGTYTISGGEMVVNKYFGAYYNSKFHVIGSGADSIEIQQISFNRAAGQNVTLAVDLDADGSTLIQVGLKTDAYLHGALLDNVIFEVGTLAGFDGEVGDVYDILWAANHGISTTGMELVNTGDVKFSWDVVSGESRGFNGGDVLTVTVIPEPATLVLLGLGGVLSLRRRK